MVGMASNNWEDQRSPGVGQRCQRGPWTYSGEILGWEPNSKEHRGHNLADSKREVRNDSIRMAMFSILIEVHGSKRKM